MSKQQEAIHLNHGNGFHKEPHQAGTLILDFLSLEPWDIDISCLTLTLRWFIAAVWTDWNACPISPHRAFQVFFSGSHLGPVYLLWGVKPRGQQVCFVQIMIWDQTLDRKFFVNVFSFQRQTSCWLESSRKLTMVYTSNLHRSASEEKLFVPLPSLGLYTLFYSY